jgi:hypothetical protein
MRLTLSLASLLLLLPAVASADTLAGRVLDAVTGTPIPGAQITVLGTQHTTRTDALGRWSFELPRGTYELGAVIRVAGEVQESRLVRQYVPQIKPADIHFFSTHFVDRGVAPLAQPVGLPAGSGQLPPDMPHSFPLPGTQSFHVNGLTLPQILPTTIRVGRRERPTEGCSNNPVVAIEEMSLDDYTRGVLPPEIGVFRSLSGAAEVYKTFALAAKSYGLFFVLTYGEGNRRTVPNPLPPNNFTWFHIDDTACNQRYSDQRLTITTNASDAMAGKILVKKGEPNTLDKLEYAASCGKHGTLPEYGSVNNLIPDRPAARPCVGNWCGHDTCAGHEDNPHVAGSDRCLVRGICQWGAAGHGIDGRDYRWMIAHYQPNLEIRELNAAPVPTTVAVTGYVYTDPTNIIATGVAGAAVTITGGATATADAQGKFTFPAVDPALGKITLTASAPGYITATREKTLEPGVTNWASIQISRQGAEPPDMGHSGMEPIDAPDLPPEPDMNDASDLDDTPDLGGDLGSGLPPANRFGPLITESPGIEGGCGGCAQSPAQGPATLLIGFAGLIALRRRRA